ALPSGKRDVVLPGPGLRFGERVFGLAVQRLQHEVSVQLLVVEDARAPRERPTFGGGQVLYSVERERGERGHLPAPPSLARRSQRVRRVGDDGDAAEGLLALGCGPPSAARDVQGGEQPVVIAHAPRYV